MSQKTEPERSRGSSNEEVLLLAEIALLRAELQHLRETSKRTRIVTAVIVGTELALGMVVFFLLMKTV